MPSDNYRQTSPNIKTSAGVISNKELKHSKFMSESIFSRSVNITDHYRTHKYSGYFLVKKKYSHKFDVVIQSNLSLDDQYISASGDKFAILKYWEYRIKYGVALDFDYSGKNNKTRGIPPKYFTSI